MGSNDTVRLKFENLKVQLRLFVGTRFQELFHPPVRGTFHLSLTVLYAIGQLVIFRLGGWSPHVQTGFHVSRPTRGSKCFLLIQGYHLLWLGFPSHSNSYTYSTGLVHFRSPLLTESRLISFPGGTEMFQFSPFAFYIIEVIKYFVAQNLVMKHY